MIPLSCAARVAPAAATALLLAGVATAQKAQPTRPGRGQELRVTEIQVPGKPSVARVWTERQADGTVAPFYSLSLDGKSFTEPIKTSYDLELRFENFDPVARRAAVPANLRADGGNRLNIVQYWTQGIEDYREVIRGLGGEIHMFLANNSNVIEMDAATRRAVEELPFVRSITPFHPGYKLEEELLEGIALHQQGEIKVNLLTTRRHGHEPVMEWVQRNGGTVDHVSKETYLMTATLRHEQLPQLAALNEVQWIDRWTAPGIDMNIARTFHGATAQENAKGYIGSDVTVEVLDGGVTSNHPDLPNFIVHNGNSNNFHGTGCAGIVLGRGVGNPNARGMAPGAGLVVGNYNAPYSGGSRYAHTAELQNPGLPYKCVLQTNSWGGGRTTQYTAASQNMDTILFDLQRITITQSQSNAGNQQSRPQAWAKNIVAVGGINHRNTLTKSDDAWGGASVGPAADNRLKPDLSSFYDAIFTTTTGSGYQSFGGTSGATPIIAGSMVLFYEMWHRGEFPNVLPGAWGGGATPFDSRPNNTTAKAVTICLALVWPFQGTNHNLRRTRQGWGHAAGNLQMNASDLVTIVDETDVLTELQSTSYTLNVAPNLGQVRATMVYRDPGGTTSSTLHRINNLDLKVTSPSGVVYWGNNQMRGNIMTQPGGSPNGADTVENVWLRLPEPGNWTIEVIAAEVNQDSHVETPAVDVDYALVFGAGGKPNP